MTLRRTTQVCACSFLLQRCVCVCFPCCFVFDSMAYYTGFFVVVCVFVFLDSMAYYTGFFVVVCLFFWILWHTTKGFLLLCVFLFCFDSMAYYTGFFVVVCVFFLCGFYGILHRICVCVCVCV